MIVSAVVFVLFYVFPSADPAQLRAGRQANADQIAAIRESLGLDKSVLTQFWIYIKGVFTPLDLPGTDAHGPLYFGRSYQSNADVKDVIFSDLPGDRAARLRRRDPLAGDRDPGRDHLGGQAAARCSTARR